MKKTIYLLVLLGLNSMGIAQVSIGVDVYSRYVWRGTDFGNSATVQPSIEYAMAGFTVGAWSAWSPSGAAGGNENDLYLGASLGPVDLTLTDYFFPEYQGTDSLFNMDKHIFELSAGFEVSGLSSVVAMNLSGDDDNSLYLELTYGMLTLGAGNGAYTVKDDPDFNIVNIGITASRDIYSASFIINPEQETSFLVFGFSL